MWNILKDSMTPTLTRFVLIIGVLNFVLFQYPFFNYVFSNIDYTSFNGVLAIVSLMVLMVVANAFVFYILLYLLRVVGKALLVIFFIINAVAVYFINTYSVILDESMIGNVLNTNYEESSNFFSFKIILYIIILGVLPSIYIIKAKIIRSTFKRFITTTSLTLLFVLVMIFVNAGNWLWIDNHSKYLGGLAMPWSYTVNISLYYTHKYKENRKEILLPDAKIKNNEKAVVVLVIGESARSENFSLYGYAKNTNPLLSQMEDISFFPAKSGATYTTAAVKHILEHKNTRELYEILPNYLYRNGVEVVWRTTNSGEPPIHIEKFQNRKVLAQNCQGEGCSYDEILITGLKEQILASTKSKVLIILHTSTSHGPTYNKRYPPQFEVFKPVCESVELANCSHEELINAYDNTIVYTDYLLSKIIETLKELSDYKKTMLFVSDHGESLGEKNLYMHGLPMSVAPKEQYEIPFIIWTDSTTQIKPATSLSQNHVFHSVLNFLEIESPVYNEDMNIFCENP
ncbi:MAG TPA: phosphoethanolamine--lipid A transferase EptA [Tenuifilaceae bacterium]|nr:phosphoethanolamine--lipid A transferase EptA [Tenuifilaceae bacterium]HPX04295.1 phosphoethanolamine--lipid A transferase EptA [Tenuifilaceae bacterium]